MAALQSIVTTEFTSEFEAISWQITEIPSVDPLIGDVVLGVVREVIRNAAVHGRGDQACRSLHLGIKVLLTDVIQIQIEDDGVGIGSAPSNATPIGSGGGLALHSTLLAMMGGSLLVEPRSGAGTRATISIP